MKKIIVISTCLALVIALAIGSRIVQTRMNDIRESEKLTATSVVENAPPVVAFTTVALGGFRGLVADLLWLRLQRKQEAGSYFEMVQLASWITKLQPRFTGATAYLAWNMAYNISVTFNRPEDRWRWVQRGIELIRDEALVYNPADPTLFKELGWIYQHKLGQEMDDANLYYKWQLAKKMMDVLGEYPVDWRKWNATPITIKELKDSLTQSEHPKLIELMNAPEQVQKLEKQFWDAVGTIPEAATASEMTTSERERLALFFRVRRLQNELKLDPGLMAELDDKYGDFDWRLPEAHAVYWASRGLEYAEGGTNIACERMVFQSLHNAFIGGRLVYLETEETDKPIIQFTPNVNLADAVNRAYHTSLEQHPEQSSVRSSHKNFLRHAVATLYSFGQEKQASEYLNELRERYPGAENKVPLEEYVIRRLAGDIATASYDQGQGLVQAYLWQTCYNLALGEFERAQAMERIARQIWIRYMKSIGESTHERRGLAPFEKMREGMFRNCLEQFPPELAARLRTAAAQWPGAPKQFE